MNPTISSNPLLTFASLTPFDRIQAAHVAPAVEHLLQTANAALETVTAADFPARWNDVARVLDVATEQLSRAWSAVSHLSAVIDTPELRAAYNESLPPVTEFWTRLGADERLFAKYKAMDVNTLNAEQLQAHKNAVRNFVLGGAELTGPARDRFAQIAERQASLSQKFSENALDATDAFAYYASAEEVAGVPEDVLQTALAAAQAQGKSGYKLTLKMPCYLPVMQFAHSASLRQTLYRAYSTRCSDQAAPDGLGFDNSELIQEILALRQEEAQLLGFANFGELSLVPKMAQSPRHVIDFLRDLAQRAKPFGEADVADLRAFAKEQLSLADPQAWDWPYISEKLKEARYAFSEHDVKPYFTAPRVMQGLFKIIETLFAVQIHPDHAPVWHPDVEFYRIERAAPPGTDRGNTLVGQFYLDRSARAGKRGGAWMDDARTRWLRPDTGLLQTPVAHLVCNFASGTSEGAVLQPALLTHDDVTTLFHEFGHGLHHLLTQVSERDVSGISGVEWDAVELPSQFMENFCWEWDVLKHMTAHVKTGEPLPRALFDKMLAAKNFQSGMQTLRQIEFSLFDMLLHTQPVQAVPALVVPLGTVTHLAPVSVALGAGDSSATARLPSHGGINIVALADTVRAQVAVIQPPTWSRSFHTFSHIFAGGYAAGYYSYKWAEVLSADVYAAFEETAGADGLPNQQTGRKYLETILQVGGSRPAMASFQAFRGREPSLDALLRHQGMSDGAGTVANVSPVDAVVSTSLA